MDEGLGVNAKELLEALSRNAVPLPHEIGTFLALQVCERVLSQPAVVELDTVWVSEDGNVRLTVQGAASESAAARSIIALLGQLLVRSAPGVPETLLSLVERDVDDGSLALTGLRDELEAALVPLNREATKRVLARVLREASRERPRSDAGFVDEAEVAAELDELLGVDAAEADRVRAERKQASASGSARPHGSQAEEAGERPSQPDSRRVPDSLPPTMPRLRPVRPRDSGPASEQQFVQLVERQPRQTLVLWMLLALMLIAGGIAFFLSRDRGSDEGSESGTSRATDRRAAPSSKQRSPGTRAVHLSSIPYGAQVLMRVGRGGAPIDGFSIGEAHELVAFPAGGDAPVRMPIPSDANWVAGKLTVDLPEPRSTDGELGPTLIGPELGHPTGRLGTITVKAPPEVAIYKLVGLTPGVRLEGLPPGQAVELCFYRRGFPLAKMRISPEQLAVTDTASGPLERTVELAADAG